MRLHPFSLIATLTVAALLAACGGGGQKASNTAAKTYGYGKSMAGSAANRLGAAVPGRLHCGAQPPVWVNPRTHVYHMQGDQYYGHTKNGQYMCMQDAVSAGYHAAGSHHGKHAGSTSGGAMPESSPAM